MSDHPQTGPRHQHERIYERSADPAEGADRPLEPRTPDSELSTSDDPAGVAKPTSEDPHHRLNTPVGEPDPAADSDPYRTPTEDDEQDHASGTRGSGQGSEQ
ncbi:MAG TPA: hypothetical protein VF781_10480 [Solirubrobacteraceae bacterium]